MIRQQFLLLGYNKDVICVLDKGKKTICTILHTSLRRTAESENLPSYDPYIPRDNVVFYNCTRALECKKVKLISISEVSNPKIQLNACYLSNNNDFKCEQINYNHLKIVDKLLFLSKSIVGKSFFIVDCLVQEHSELRVCTRRGEVYSHEKVVETESMINLNESSTLSQDEFICEEDHEGEIVCDHNKYVPYSNGVLKIRDSSDEDVLLKTASKLVLLKYDCINNWCGHIGHLPKPKTRRHYYPYSHEDPGGQTFVCYYSNRQQVCKEVEEKKPTGFLLNMNN